MPMKTSTYHDAFWQNDMIRMDYEIGDLRVIEGHVVEPTILPGFAMFIAPKSEPGYIWLAVERGKVK